MPLNLITDPWIPVRLDDGSRRVIAPHEMADPAIAAPDWPRADLNLACYELLIGLVFMACPPSHLDDWSDNVPDAATLAEKLAPYAPAFNLLGDGPRFSQDIDDLPGDPSSPDFPANRRATLLAGHRRFAGRSVIAGFAFHRFRWRQHRQEQR